MNRTVRTAVAAELVKLWTLPAVLATMIGTVVAGAALGAALAASATVAVEPVQVTLQTLTPVQAGAILLGVLAVAPEYAGRQISTTLTAVPHRPALLAGKAIATLGTTTVAGLVTVTATATTARLVLGAHDSPGGTAPGARSLLAAVLYLALLGLLGLALGVLLRSLVAPLVTLLALVLVVSPLLAGVTEHARWLPDRAGRLLYLPEVDPVLSPVTGAAVLLAWVAATGAAAAVRFVRHDA